MWAENDNLKKEIKLNIELPNCSMFLMVSKFEKLNFMQCLQYFNQYLKYNSSPKYQLYIFQIIDYISIFNKGIHGSTKQTITVFY